MCTSASGWVPGATAGPFVIDVRSWVCHACGRLGPALTQPAAFHTHAAPAG
jgi:hypothetical protein